MATKIGFYICHCGINISYRVRVEEVAEFISRMPNVVVSRDYKFMCSDPGQEMIEKDIKQFGLNRVVVASCSPRFHEKTFQGACLRAGLNPYYFQMASVREQVSWVTTDEEQATRKAKTLAAAAVTRVNQHQSLKSHTVAVNPDIMVVGGGIAGMQAALDISSSGNKVYLVEKESSIGGHMLQFDKTFPTLDCAACIGTPKMVEVAQNPNIKLLSYSEVKNVSGYIGNYEATILRKPRFVKEGICTGCGECEKVCPVLVPSEWDEKLGNRHAIFRTFPQAVPITYLIDKKDRAPCSINCPAGINVHGYVQLVGKGKYTEAVRLIMEQLPLPGVLGRVCPHPCELHCRREEVDQPVSIRELKRVAADRANLDEIKRQLPKIENRKEKVAIIGSGPAGLTAAYYLRLKGYLVTIFEALDVLGGMLKVGIPDYRLPPEVLTKEIDFILRLGVETRTGIRFGTDITLQSLQEEGFAAVFLGIGAHKPVYLGIPGETETEGVLDAIRFLRDVNLGNLKCPGNRVVVLGGGDVAIDSARVIKRLGAEEVSIVYRRSANEMPAAKEEIEGAINDRIQFAYLAAPLKIIEKNGKVAGMQFIRTELGEADSSGRRRPVPITGSEFVIPCDVVIPAIGQKVDASWADREPTLKWSDRKTLEINPYTKQTSIPNVFAAGDAVTGPATVVQAVGDAHKAAEGLHLYLTGQDLKAYEESVKSRKQPGQDWRKLPDKMLIEERAHPQIKASSSLSFQEESQGLDEAAAKNEAARCLNCGTCCECLECVKVCEPKAIDHGMKAEEIKVNIGSIIVATGFSLMDATPVKQFGYGKYANVFTSLEFERLSNATGPTGGKILIRDEHRKYTKIPKSVALIHCVGSRDTNYHQYCSRVCCMYALKYSHLIKEKVGHDTAIYDFYIDMRCFGKGYEEFYMRCQNEGTNFIRGKVAQITDKAESPDEEGKLIAIAEDTLLGERIRVPVDMVVLCLAMEARAEAQEVARTFGLNVGADGFFLEEHPKLAPLSTPTDGVFLAGTCQGPKDIPDTVAQASGAAVKALALSVKGEVTVPPTISYIDPVICSGCQVCIGLCVYGAIDFDARRGISVVNEALCKGCGSCAGHCPSNAATIRHFNPKQIFAEMNGLLNAIHQVGI